jgi:hypothetical protein
LERFLLQESSKTMLSCDFFNDLHDDKILINLCRNKSKQRSELELVRGNLSVSSAKRNTHSKADLLDFLHTFERR